MTSRLRVLFAGTPDVAVPTLDAVAAAHDVVAVLTRPPARRRRRGPEEPGEVALAAAERGLPVLEWPTLRTPEAAEQLAALELDAAVVVAYGQLVPRNLLDVPRLGWINLHFSLLPAWRGAAPVQWAIRQGDQVSGASVFQLTAGLDEGDVIGTMTEQIRARDTSGDLLGRLAVAGASLAVNCLNALADGSAHPIPQSSDGVSFAPRIDVASAQVPWHLPALAVDRFVRSMTPAPGAWAELDGVRVKIGPVLPSWAPRRSGANQPEVELAPGEIWASKKQVFVGTGGDAVELGEVAPAGKQWMPASDWARGARLNPGSRFDDPRATSTTGAGHE